MITQQLGTITERLYYGHIQSTNVSFTDNRAVYQTGMIGADYTSAPGDSGGLLFGDIHIDNSCGVMGIHKGYANGYRVFTPYEKITGALNIYRY